MKRFVKFVISIFLVILTVHMTVGVTFSRCAHSGKMTYGLSHEAEDGDGETGFHCGCLEIFTEILPEYTPSAGPEYSPAPAVLAAAIQAPVPVLPAVRNLPHALQAGPPAALRLLGSVLLRR